MNYKSINLDFLINKITTKDKLFGGNYTIDPYQNCEFGCTYCDSSLEKTVYIKKNAPDIFEKDLKNIKKGTIIVGSVHDPYQKIEKKELITRKILEIIKKYNFSCHILTKSDLVLRDADIISEIKDSRVTISISSIKNDVTKYFENNVPSPETRLKTIKKLIDIDIKTGIAIIPILPFIVDNELEDIIKNAKKHNAQYILYKHLELKGDQKNCFLMKLKEFQPDLISKYENMYKEYYLPDKKYIDEFKVKIGKICEKYGIKNKI
jgi:DNA repair photolyase